MQRRSKVSKSSEVGRMEIKMRRRTDWQGIIKAQKLVKHCIQQPTECKEPTITQRTYDNETICGSSQDSVDIMFRNWKMARSKTRRCNGMQKVISKLLMSVGNWWNTRVQFTQKNQIRDPDFAGFINFADEENELVNDPLHSWDTVDQHTERKERERKSFNKRDRWLETIAIQLEEDSRENSLAKDTKDVILCVMCTKIHDLEQCKACVTKFVE